MKRIVFPIVLLIPLFGSYTVLAQGVGIHAPRILSRPNS